MKDKFELRFNDVELKRSISDIYLAEVSAVRNPAYVQSTNSARSIDIVDDPQINLPKENNNKMFDTKVHQAINVFKFFSRVSIEASASPFVLAFSGIYAFPRTLRNHA
ncbi:hypothetical protein [Bacillus subtilis]|uniref:hypothetical protein n=1 Tax=Bacillus subtilis TaxID=1423 RepID=UPI00145B176E|nr:hypothetical protein [Bacillus subtilis]